MQPTTNNPRFDALALAAQLVPVARDSRLNLNRTAARIEALTDRLRNDVRLLLIKADTTGDREALRVATATEQAIRDLLDIVGKLDEASDALGRL
jgi:hypothetical protein